jgi:hypothetical protein
MIWYIFYVLDQEKSGNPGARHSLLSHKRYQMRFFRNEKNYATKLVRMVEQKYQNTRMTRLGEFGTLLDFLLWAVL